MDVSVLPPVERPVTAVSFSSAARSHRLTESAFRSAIRLSIEHFTLPFSSLRPEPDRQRLRTLMVRSRGIPLSATAASSFLLLNLMEDLLEQEPEPVPHGTSVFDVHRNCECRLCERRRTCVEELLWSFSAIPTRWIAGLRDAWRDPIALPMWGELYLICDGSVAEHLRSAAVDIESDSDDLIELAYSGWQMVGDSGVLIREFDDELLLGIHGAGYDFFEAHWVPLYDALGYQWHLK